MTIRNGSIRVQGTSGSKGVELLGCTGYDLNHLSIVIDGDDVTPDIAVSAEGSYGALCAVSCYLPYLHLERVLPARPLGPRHSPGIRTSLVVCGRRVQ